MTTLVLLVVAVAAHGMAQDVMRQYNKLAGQPSAELMQLGRDCFARHQDDNGGSPEVGCRHFFDTPPRQYLSRVRVVLPGRWV